MGLWSTRKEDGCWRARVKAQGSCTVLGTNSTTGHFPLLLVGYPQVMRLCCVFCRDQVWQRAALAPAQSAFHKERASPTTSTYEYSMYS
jgi:hypothetical protein